MRQPPPHPAERYLAAPPPPAQAPSPSVATAPHQECANCKSALEPGTLACGICHGLVHAALLERLASDAHLHEQHGETDKAHGAWVQALTLLPPDSAQAEWIRGNMQRLEPAAKAKAETRLGWAKKFGPIAPLLIVLAKSKFLIALFKLKFLLSLGTFVAFYWALYGMKFGVGFAALILVHEMGHFIDIKRRGLPADMPVFLPGLGAYVRWAALGVTAEVRAFVSLAGPMAGCIGAAVCAMLWIETGEPFWIGLAGVSAMLNVLNLIPVWVLDGGHAIAALDKRERIILSGAALLMAGSFGQPLFVLVAAGAAYRVFTKDIPAASSPAATAYYVLLLAALGFLITLSPRSPGAPAI